MTLLRLAPHPRGPHCALTGTSGIRATKPRPPPSLESILTKPSRLPIYIFLPAQPLQIQHNLLHHRSELTWPFYQCAHQLLPRLEPAQCGSLVPAVLSFVTLTTAPPCLEDMPYSRMCGVAMRTRFKASRGTWNNAERTERLFRSSPAGLRLNTKQPKKDPQLGFTIS